jgi:hypothetical protein
MTIERPMFPSRAEAVDSFSLRPDIGQRESGNLASESRKPAERLSRRLVLAGVASAAAIPIVAAAPTARTVDADLIEFGARFEPLVDQYYVARKPWARLMVAARTEHDRKYGEADYTPERMAARSECFRRLGVDAASAALHAAYEDTELLTKAINAAPVNSIEGLRAKALVAFFEVAPLCGRH